MKTDKQYEVNIFGLKMGSHYFNFTFDDKLFASIENSILKVGTGTCKVVLNKRDTIISLHFEIQGSIPLVCDRSLEPFDFPLHLNENLNLKYGKAFDNSRDDFWIIPDTQESINIASCIYEYVTVAIPIKNLHPKFEDIADEDNLTLLYSSEDNETKSEKRNTTMDPRWEVLKSIKNLEQ